jgi:DMSO/TMAO reductase YedYZ molybdopterin-dependent catalytic subunit
MDTLWKGVSSSALATLAGVKPQARFVIVSAPGAFSTNLSLDDFLADDVILAWEYGHELLAPEHGGPLRLIVPRLYFWKSIKWLTKIHFSDVDRPGYWERAGYHNHGDPWREERFSPERARRQAGL